jgi:hypothetical protein
MTAQITSIEKSLDLWVTGFDLPSLTDQVISSIPCLNSWMVAFLILCLVGLIVKNLFEK